MDSDRVSVPTQLGIGAALAVVVCGVVVLLTLVGVPIGTAAWVGVFFTIWAIVFAAMRLRWIAMLVSFLVVEFGIYLALAVVGSRLWWER